MKEFWSKRIYNAVPYTPGEQPKDQHLIKLNTNECPYPPSPLALKAIRDAADDHLRLYPDPDCQILREAIARREKLSPDQIFCSNGSDEVLAFAFQAFFNSDSEIVIPAVTYSFYPVYVKYFNLTCRTVPMNSDFTVPIDLLCGENGGVVLANPNAPTGIAVGLDVIEKILAANQNAVVVIDEAYVDFGADSAACLIEKYPNLLVVQTASKSRSLAGLRVGWAMGNANLIQALCCVRDSMNSYTVDRIAMAGAAAAVKDEVYFQNTCRKVMKTREWVTQSLTDLGFQVTPSLANFLFISYPGMSGENLMRELRRKDILVRWWDTERIKDWLRVSIGTESEMNTLVQVLKQLVA